MNNRPRVDFLPNDVYPKCMAYEKLICRADKPLLGTKLKVDVFNDKKTDHHAIIPTGVQSNLQISNRFMILQSY
jgi:DNA topoisomerase-3